MRGGRGVSAGWIHFEGERVTGVNKQRGGGGQRSVKGGFQGVTEKRAGEREGALRTSEMTAENEAEP